VAQFLVDRVQFIAAKPLDVRLAGEEERILTHSRNYLLSQAGEAPLEGVVVEML
jgi:hypothetical protein